MPPPSRSLSLIRASVFSRKASAVRLVSTSIGISPLVPGVDDGKQNPPVRFRQTARAELVQHQQIGLHENPDRPRLAAAAETVLTVRSISPTVMTSALFLWR
ncbi:hypothetical protein ND010_08580 [Neisseria gonorrhoeae]|nr:hypothetical protein [Neisseria gonorrhoeae]UYA63273.1 hypothetical protein ND010_08580 [Neisseria gonorrhoeae]